MYDTPVFEQTTAPTTSAPPMEQINSATTTAPSTTTSKPQQREISFIFPSPVKDGQPRSRKLRASCDSCSLAKVRCSKEHPICQRCKNIGHKCNYSPSMRLGKPRSIHKKPKPDNKPAKPLLSPTGAKLENDLMPHKPIDLTDSSMYNLGPQDTSIDALLGLDGTLLPDVTDPAAINQLMNNTIYFPNSEPFGRQASMSDMSDSTFGDYLSGTGMDSMDFTPDFTFDSPDSGNFSASGPSVSSQSSDSGEELNNYFIDPKSTQNIEMSFPANALDTPISLSPSGSPTRKSSHDCTELAFKTLNTLYSCESTHSKSGSFPNTFSALENIISENDRAMEAVEHLLACPCSISPHFSTTLCFILLKVLSLCNIATGLERGDTSSLIPRSSIECDNDAARAQQAQARIAGLRKVEKVVDDFSSRFSRNTETGKTIDEMVYVHQERMLRKMLRKAAGSLMSGVGGSDF